MRRIASLTVLLLLLSSMLAVDFHVQSAEADFETVYIRADGSVEPFTAPISSLDNVTYTFTGNINGSLVIERNDIVVDGAGFAVQGNWSGTGVDLNGRANVTVKGMVVRDFGLGVNVVDSYGISILNNVITNNSGSSDSLGRQSGVYLENSGHNVISQNNITNHYSKGVYVVSIGYDQSDGNVIVENHIENVNATAGVFLNAEVQNNVVSKNNLTNCLVGVLMWYDDNNIITENNIDARYYGISLYGGGVDNVFSRNVVMNASYGIQIDIGEHNTFTENNITNNNHAVSFLHWPTNNIFYHNNFINNAEQLSYSSHYLASNLWNLSYPGGGNYWSDYAGADLFSGPYQNETGGDGIGDSAYVLNLDNADNYPLIRPWNVENPVHNINTGLSYAEIQEALDADETTSGNTIFVDSGIYFENVDVNKTVWLVGENAHSAIIDGNGADYTVFINSVNGAAITNLAIINGTNGLFLTGNSSRISENEITRNGRGVMITQGSHNVIERNMIESNEDGIHIVENCENNLIRGNLLNNNTIGVNITATGNVIEYNTITENTVGTEISGANNVIRYNNFTYNTQQVVLTSSYENFWDDGYPSGGNYWSDYVGADFYHGAYQNETGSDGIGEPAYVIDASNQDNYPLMNPWTTPNLTIEAVNFSRTTIGYGYVSNVTVNVTVKNQGNKIENSTLTVTVNGTILTSEHLLLANLSSTIRTYTWNITDLAKSVYSIQVYLTPAQEEVNTLDNTFDDDLYIAMAGDLTSMSSGVPDFRVDMRDIGEICGKFGAMADPPVGSHYLVFVVSQDNGPVYGNYSGNITINGQTYSFASVDAYHPFRIDFEVPASPETEVIIYAVGPQDVFQRFWAVTFDRLMTPLVPNQGYPQADFNEAHWSGSTMNVKKGWLPNWDPNIDINDDGLVNMRDIGIACNNFMKT